MNNRIREIAEHVGYVPLPGFDFANNLQEVFLEKFAYALIQECCKCLVEQGEGWLQFAKNPPVDQTHNVTGALFAAYRLKEDAVSELKEHFGIE